MRDAQGAIGLMTLLTEGERKRKEERKRRSGKRVHRRGQIITSLVPSLFFFLALRDNDQHRIPGNWLAGDVASGLLTC